MRQHKRMLQQKLDKNRLTMRMGKYNFKMIQEEGELSQSNRNFRLVKHFCILIKIAEEKE